MNRSSARPMMARLMGLALLCGAMAVLWSPAGAEPRELVIEALAFTGNTRTDDARARAAAGLAAGDAASPEAIVAAAERLRRSGLFREVQVHTRPGTSPGLVQVVFAVQENRPHLRFGLGYEDFSGWYVIPVQLNLDNLTGHGESVRLCTRLGYRVAGILLSARGGLFGLPRTAWEARLRAEGQDRIYFQDGTEIRHHLGRGGADLELEHRPLPGLTLKTWVSSETVEPDSTAEVYRDNELTGREQGDDLSWTDLPPSIQDDVGKAQQARYGLAVVYEEHRGLGLSTQGIRGRVSGEGIHGEDDDFGVFQGDLRAYFPLREGLQLAGRLRYGTVSAEAPFHERFYLGGLTTVRGYPSQSLSPPGGHLSLATASVELRAAWIGPADDPRLTGSLFLDLGAGGNGGFPDLEQGAAGVGYGLRYRLPWVGGIGLDVGFPLSPAPVDESFHVNLSLGMTF